LRPLLSCCPIEYDSFVAIYDIL